MTPALGHRRLEILFEEGFGKGPHRGDDEDEVKMKQRGSKEGGGSDGSGLE